VDNDQDGVTDCDDADCAADPSCVESECNDQVDNDGDGDTDCDDSDCAAAPNCNPEAVCDDDIDNDLDGDTDCDDTDCATDPVCLASLKPGDANGDGILDMSDPMAVLDFFFSHTGPITTNGCFATATGGIPAWTLTATGLAILDWNGDGVLDIADPTGQLTWQFLSTRPHHLCTDQDCTNCVEILDPDCADSCP
jgi:hypothetical protein